MGVVLTVLPGVLAISLIIAVVAWGVPRSLAWQAPFLAVLDIGQAGVVPRSVLCCWSAGFSPTGHGGPGNDDDLAAETPRQACRKLGLGSRLGNGKVASW